MASIIVYTLLPAIQNAAAGKRVPIHSRQRGGSGTRTGPFPHAQNEFTLVNLDTRDHSCSLRERGQWHPVSASVATQRTGSRNMTCDRSETMVLRSTCPLSFLP
eukprot:749062-Prymnesium_polylepis.2